MHLSIKLYSATFSDLPLSKITEKVCIGNLEMFGRQADISFSKHGDSSINSLYSFCSFVFVPKNDCLLTFYISV